MRYEKACPLLFVFYPLQCFMKQAVHTGTKGDQRIDIMGNVPIDFSGLEDEVHH